MAIEDYFESGITVQRSTETKKTSGKVKETWTDHLSISGRIRPLTGDERMASDKVTLFATHRLYTAVADIMEKDRVVKSGIVYDVKYVHNPMNFDEFLQVDMELVQ